MRASRLVATCVVAVLCVLAGGCLAAEPVDADVDEGVRLPYELAVASSGTTCVAPQPVSCPSPVPSTPVTYSPEQWSSAASTALGKGGYDSPRLVKACMDAFRKNRGGRGLGQADLCRAMSLCFQPRAVLCGCAEDGFLARCGALGLQSSTCGLVWAELEILCTEL